MFWQGYYGDACVLSENEFDAFLKEYAKQKQIDLNKLIDKIDEDGVDNYTFKSDAGGFSFISVSGDSCEGMELISLVEEGESRYCENSIVLFAKHDRLSGKAFKNPPYPSYEDLVNEFKDFLQEYLPNGFDWNNHVGVFRYACFA